MAVKRKESCSELPSTRLPLNGIHSRISGRDASVSVKRKEPCSDLPSTGLPRSGIRSSISGRDASDLVADYQGQVWFRCAANCQLPGMVLARDSYVCEMVDYGCVVIPITNINSFA